MYKINDYIIHKNNHLYQIIAIHNHTCILTTWQTNETIITNITELVRKVITASEMEEIVERIPYIRTLNITSERYRQELYQKSLDKYDEVEWIKLIKTIYIRHQKKQTQNYELKYFKAGGQICKVCAKKIQQDKCGKKIKKNCSGGVSKAVNGIKADMKKSKTVAPKQNKPVNPNDTVHI